MTTPDPETVTVNASPSLKPAVTLSAAFIAILQGSVPVQPAPLQPPKKEFVAGDAVTVTSVLGAKLAEHVVGQLIPAGLLVTDPVPETASVNVSGVF